ncbi:MAG: NifU family protein [Planctomycetota bacterium]
MTPSPSQSDASGLDSPSTLYERVQAVIERIRPAVQSDGGDVELVELTDEGVARIRLHGACIGCPSSSMTLHMGIERNLRERIPEVTGVEQVD